MQILNDGAIWQIKQILNNFYVNNMSSSCGPFTLKKYKGNGFQIYIDKIVVVTCYKDTLYKMTFDEEIWQSILSIITDTYPNKYKIINEPFIENPNDILWENSLILKIINSIKAKHNT